MDCLPWAPVVPHNHLQQSQIPSTNRLWKLHQISTVLGISLRLIMSETECIRVSNKCQLLRERFYNVPVFPLVNDLSIV